MSAKRMPDRETLERLYITEGLDTPHIGPMFNVHRNTVAKWLRYFNIPRRGRGRMTREIVTRDALALLWNEQHSLRGIAKHFQVGMNTILRRAAEYDLGPKPIPPVHGSFSPVWTGGCEDYRGPEPEWNRTRDVVRQRDGYRCRRCGITEAELGKAMNIHHVKPFGSFAGPAEANAESNLVAVCQACHSKIERRPQELPEHPDPSLRGINSPDAGERHIRPMIVNPQRVAVCYLMGHPVATIAVMLRAHAQTIYRALRRAGVRPAAIYATRRAA